MLEFRERDYMGTLKTFNILIFSCFQTVVILVILWFVINVNRKYL